MDFLAKYLDESNEDKDTRDDWLITTDINVHDSFRRMSMHESMLWKLRLS